MRNRFKRASYALAAGVAVAATIGLSAAGASASTGLVRPNATNACSFHCTDVNFQVPGSQALLGVHSGLAFPNNLVRLVQGSNSAYKEDFSEVNVGTVVPLYCTPTGFSISPLFTSNQCHLLVISGLGPAMTFQLAYNPNNGGDETLCIGAWDNNSPNSGARMRLVDCGVAGDTVMIRTKILPGGTTTTGYWLINGASDNFSNPLVASSNGTFPSDPTWSTVVKNGKKGIDTQEVHLFDGPF